jgi:nanoRNase/pAp phosphatase (c-di-AMP/oligoRNAs hydrolase)
MANLNQWIGAAIKRGAIAILTHKNGDMDTIGSACALANIIGPNARACGIHMSTMARAMVSKTGADFLILDSKSPSWPRDLGGVIIVDAAGPNQPGIAIPDVPKCIIDHHSAGESFEIGELDLEINWDTCSTAEIVQQWAENYAYKRINTQSRILLLAGIITDTGRFRHANANALAAAGRLTNDSEIDFSEFIEDMESVELNHSQRVAITKALSRVQTLATGRWFLSYTRAGTNEGIVARSLITAGADIALVCRRLQGETRLTARACRAATRGGIHLGELMQKMVTRSGGEGGGHAGAAGWSGCIDQTDATSGFISLLMGNQGDEHNGS